MSKYQLITVTYTPKMLPDQWWIGRKAMASTTPILRWEHGPYDSEYKAREQLRILEKRGES